MAPKSSNNYEDEGPVKNGPTATTNLPLKTTSVTSNEYVLNVAFGSFFCFTVLQFVFALTARSQAMMADCAAMAVDAITYLFNYYAERVKHREITEEEKSMDAVILHRRRRLQRLYLELIPPLISVTTLVIVTIYSLKQAIDVLIDDEPVGTPPDVIIMLVFSGLNLLLDAVNVSCFARAEHPVIGIPSTFLDLSHDRDETETELTGLLKTVDDGNDSTTYTAASHADTSLLGLDEDDDDQSSSSNHLNLNMCSAFTHVAADTLRSIATLLAAGFAALFPEVLSAANADSWGAILISIIIIVSLGPLIQGLYSTAIEIRALGRGGDSSFSTSNYSTGTS